jgi:hypothetical protein
MKRLKAALGSELESRFTISRAWRVPLPLEKMNVT